MNKSAAPAGERICFLSGGVTWRCLQTTNTWRRWAQQVLHQKTLPRIPESRRRKASHVLRAPGREEFLPLVWEFTSLTAQRRQYARCDWLSLCGTEGGPLHSWCQRSTLETMDSRSHTKHSKQSCVLSAGHGAKQSINGDYISFLYCWPSSQLRTMRACLQSTRAILQ